MKTLLIVNSQNLHKHSGEEYDDYIEFDIFLTPDKIQPTANVIRNKIRELSMKDESNDRKVKIFLDVTQPYKIIIVGLSKTMLEDEKIELILPEELIIDEEAKRREIQQASN